MLLLHVGRGSKKWYVSSFFSASGGGFFLLPSSSPLTVIGIVVLDARGRRRRRETAETAGGGLFVHSSLSCDLRKWFFEAFTMASVGDEQATGVVVCRSIVYGSIAFWQGKKAHEHHTHKWNSEFGPLWRVDALTPLAEPCPVPRAFFSRCGR